MLPYISTPFALIASKLGATTDEVKLISIFLLSYPLAGLLKRFPDNKPILKNAYIIFVSLFYLVGIFDLYAGVGTLFISMAMTYVLADKFRDPLMPWAAFVLLMGHLSVNHLYRQAVGDPGIVDITGPQMVMVMKLTAFCWNVQDGRRQEKDLADSQKKCALKTLPSILDYTAYVLFFPSLFTGPTFDFIEYKAWIETTMFDETPTKSNKDSGTSRKIPRSLLPAALKAVIGLVWILAFLVFNGRYNSSLVLSDDYLTYNILRRIWCLEMLGVTTRMKFYGVWSLTEGACILSGMGYAGRNPQTGVIEWNRLQNVRPLSIEFAQNSRAYLENWNINTNHWLRNYVYLRVTPKGKKPGFRASLATFTTSAFWHGFYPGYYLTFILAAFVQTVAKNFRRHVRPFFLMPDGERPTKNKKYYDIASYLATQAAFCFTTAPFCLLTLSDSLRVWTRVYFYPVVGIGISMAFFASPGKSWLIKRLEIRNEQKLQEVSQAAVIDQQHYPMLGLPDDPQRELQDAVDEIFTEIEQRRRRGSKVGLPSGDDLRKAVENRLGRKL